MLDINYLSVEKGDSGMLYKTQKNRVEKNVSNLHLTKQQMHACFSNYKVRYFPVEMEEESKKQSSKRMLRITALILFVTYY